jgi:plastocyanin
MKAIKLISITCLLLIAFKSYSTVHVINQSGMYFAPDNLTVNVGDVIHWVWADGTHTTTSRTIPAGAAGWNSPLNSSNSSFDYTVTVAGSYSYACNYHESMGMVGSFTAVVSTGIGESSLSQTISVYPNPAKSFINLKTDKRGEIIVSDVLGNNIKRYQSNELPTFSDSYRLDLSDLDGGVYVISFLPSDSKKRFSVKFIKE